MDIIRVRQLTDCHAPPVSAGKARIGMAVRRRVVHQVLECLLAQGWVPLRAWGSWRVPLVLHEALAVRSDMCGPVTARLRAGSRSESRRRVVHRWARDTALGRALSDGICCLHRGQLFVLTRVQNSWTS